MSDTAVFSNHVALFGEWLERSGKTICAIVAFGLVILIGAVDYLTGTEISLSVIYVFPIAIAAWYVDRYFAYALSLLSTAVYTAGDLYAGLVVSSWLVPVWNAAIRLVFYAVLIELLFQVRTLTRDLELRVRLRTRELRKEIAERERLQREIMQTAERERRRLGNDLHDGLCQHLTGIALTEQRLAAKLERLNLPEAEDAGKLVDLIEEGIKLARNLARGLQPVDVHSGGLMQALEALAASTSELFDICCRFECPSPVLVVDNWAANNLYNVAREATSNAIKHGEAGSVTISLEARSEGTLLTVQDDGKGFSVNAERLDGMGLRIMKQRAQLIGGTLEIRSSAPTGTIVTCTLPEPPVA